MGAALLTKALIDEGTYNALDIAVTETIFKRMAGEGGLELAAFDHALLGAGLTMGIRGIRIDEGRRWSILKETNSEAKEWWAKLEPFGLKRGKGTAPSALALQSLLYTRLGAPKQYNRDGNLTCDRNALNKIIEAPKSSDEAIHVARIGLELRRLEEDRKVLSKPLGADGRMHTGFGVGATVTGRWSSSRDPFNTGANLHALSRRVRSIFIPDRRFVFVSFDLAQAESNCVAHLANCQWYKDAHKSGNVHVLVGSKIWPEPFSSKESAKTTPLPWNPDQTYYDLAKRTQHGFNYKLTPHGFARQAKMQVVEAKELHAMYFSLVPEVAEWHRSVAQEIRSKHVLWTPMGRKRVFLGRPWEESTVKEAVAHVPQSTVSDINKIILWRIWSRLDPSRAQTLAEVHDSVLFMVREGDIDTVREAFEFTRVEVPIHDDVMCIAAEAQMGMNWQDWSPANTEGLKGIKL